MLMGQRERIRLAQCLSRSHKVARLTFPSLSCDLGDLLNRLSTALHTFFEVSKMSEEQFGYRIAVEPVFPEHTAADLSLLPLMKQVC